MFILLMCFKRMIFKFYAGGFTSLPILMNRFPWQGAGALSNDQSAWDQDPWIIIAVPLQVFDQ
jgi:hypothetical protein